MRRILLSLTTALVVGIGLVGAAPARADWAPHGRAYYDRGDWRAREWRGRQEWAWRQHHWHQWQQFHGGYWQPGAYWYR